MPPFIRFVTFLSGNTENRTCFTITILQDDIYENSESFTIPLSLGQGISGVEIDPPVTEVFILDEEGMY